MSVNKLQPLLWQSEVFVWPAAWQGGSYPPDAQPSVMLLAPPVCLASMGRDRADVTSN